MNLSMEDQCEHVMNIVVESRKRFGKMCTDYEQKTSLMENKILNLQLETMSNFRIKSKQNISDFETEDMGQEIDEFIQEIEERQKKLRRLQAKVRDTQRIVMQLTTDSVGRKVHQPLDAEAMLAIAKAKRATE